MPYKTLADLIHQRKIEKNQTKILISGILSFFSFCSLIYFAYQFYYFFKTLISKPKTPEALVFQIYIYFFLSFSFFFCISQIYSAIYFKRKNNKYKNLILKKNIPENEKILLLNFDLWEEIKIILSKNYTDFEDFIEKIKDFSLKIQEIENALLNIKRMQESLDSIEKENFSEDEVIQKNFLEEINNIESNTKRTKEELKQEFLKFINEFYSKIQEEFEKSSKGDARQNFFDLINHFGQKFIEFDKLEKRKEFLILKMEQIKNSIHQKLLENCKDQNLRNEFNKLPELIQNYHKYNENFLILDRYLEKNQNQINEQEKQKIKFHKKKLRQKKDETARQILEIENIIENNEFYKTKIKEIFPFNPNLSKENKITSNHILIGSDYKELLTLNNELAKLIQIPDGNHYKAYEEMMEIGEELFKIYNQNKKKEDKIEKKDEQISSEAVKTSHDPKRRKSDFKLGNFFKATTTTATKKHP